MRATPSGIKYEIEVSSERANLLLYEDGIGEYPIYILFENIHKLLEFVDDPEAFNRLRRIR